MCTPEVAWTINNLSSVGAGFGLDLVSFPLVKEGEEGGHLGLPKKAKLEVMDPAWTKAWWDEGTVMREELNEMVQKSWQDTYS